SSSLGAPRGIHPSRSRHTETSVPRLLVAHRRRPGRRLVGKRDKSDPLPGMSRIPPGKQGRQAAAVSGLPVTNVMGPVLLGKATVVERAAVHPVGAPATTATAPPCLDRLISPAFLVVPS